VLRELAGNMYQCLTDLRLRIVICILERILSIVQVPNKARS